MQVSDLPGRYRPHGWEPSADELAADERELQLERGGSQALAAEAAVLEMEALERPSVLQVVEAEIRANVSQLPADGLDLRTHLDTIERCLIEQALQRSDGIVAHAARLLGLRRTTLVEKLRKFSIAAVDPAASES